MPKLATAAIILAATLAASATLAQNTILKSEPAMGRMKPGEIVHVDDGKCATGQVRRVVGGDHVKVGGKNRVERTSTCVARPQ